MRKTGPPGRVSWRKCNWVILDEKVGVNQVGGEWICKGIRNLRGLGKSQYGWSIPGLPLKERGQVVLTEEDTSIMCHTGSLLSRPWGEGEGVI